MFKLTRAMARAVLAGTLAAVFALVVMGLDLLIEAVRTKA